MRHDANDRSKGSTLALRLAVALAMLGIGPWPALAAAGPTDAVSTAMAAGTSDDNIPAEATEAGGEVATVGSKDEAAQAPQDAGRRRQSVSPLERRVSLLAKELGLDAAQRARVKKVLQGQREQVARVWNDESIPAARRVSATQAIGDRSADQIRALLTEEQRKRYIQPRQRDVAVGTAGADAQSWMNTGVRK